MKTVCKFFGLFCVFLVLRISFLVSEHLLAVPGPSLPLIINTWHFKEANEVGWSILHESKEQNALKALVEGLTTCERLQCDGTVGFGGSPDEKGDTSLDAMIMDGKNQNMGAVAGMKNIKDAAKVAKYVLEHTEHSLLVGDSATEFAEMMGFKKESLATKESLKKWFLWFSSSCQPNFWKNVSPNPKRFCGPYKPVETNQVSKLDDSSEYKTRKLDNRYYYNFGMQNHDTIGMIVVNNKGEFFAGTSTNGAIHKIPGRVGDSPIPGAGAYADNEVGAAVATGDGDIMMRFLPSALAVEYLRLGFEPEKAANYVMRRILSKYPQLSGAIVVVSKLGAYAAACAGMKKFPYSIVTGDAKAASRIQYKECLTPFSSKKNDENNCVQNELKLRAEINELKLKIEESESIQAKCSISDANHDADTMAKSKEHHDIHKSFKDWKKSKRRK